MRCALCYIAMSEDDSDDEYQFRGDKRTLESYPERDEAKTPKVGTPGSVQPGVSAKSHAAANVAMLMHEQSQRHARHSTPQAKQPTAGAQESGTPDVSASRTAVDTMMQERSQRHAKQSTLGKEPFVAKPFSHEQPHRLQPSTELPNLDTLVIQSKDVQLAQSYFKQINKLRYANGSDVVSAWKSVLEYIKTVPRF